MEQLEYDGYNAFDNSSKCYSLAIRELRLEGIRSGKIGPRKDNPEEMQIAREAGYVIDPVHHRISS